MNLTVQIKLLPSKEQEQWLTTAATEYISLVNDIVDYALGQGMVSKFSSGDVAAPLPAAVKNQAIRDARSIYGKCRKTHIQHTLRKPIILWNNQNYRISEGFISVPLCLNGKTHRIQLRAATPPDILSKMASGRLGTLRVTQKNGKWIAQVAYEARESAVPGTKAMGVDLGILCPAVVVHEDGRTRFIGNGRQNRFVRRKHHARRKKLGKAKKLNAIRKSEDKEQRWMRDRDHKISRAIIDEAIANGVGIIKLETLSGIRSKTRKSLKNKSRSKSRKYNRSLSSWSFYRLASYIEYKARLAGIEVQYIDPAYTSQICPHCGCIHKAEGRNYICPHCGYRGHRDRVGAVNILAA